jgi:hypothetical protein
MAEPLRAAPEKMKIYRKDAFRLIRHHVGEEICPRVYRAKRAADALQKTVDADSLRELLNSIDELPPAAETADRLRQVLVTYIIFKHSNPPPKSCPNCQKALPEHNDKCLYARLERAVLEFIALNENES